MEKAFKFRIYPNKTQQVLLQKSLKDLDVAYKNFFARPEAGFPKFKGKHDRHKSYRTSYTNGNIEFLVKKIQVCHSL